MPPLPLVALLLAVPLTEPEVPAALRTPIPRESAVEDAPLNVVLEFLSDLADVPFDVDADAFAAIGIKDIGDQAVQFPPGCDCRLDEFLTRVFAPLLPAGKGSVAYRVKPDGVILLVPPGHGRPLSPAKK